MDAKFKHEWDYLGWKQYGDSGLYSQNAWNQTVLTKINQSSAQIGKESYRGGGNNLFVHPKTYVLLKDLEFFNINGSEASIAGRYKINVDDSIDQDKIYVKHIDKDFEKVKEHLKKPNLCRAIKVTKNEGDSMSELVFKFIEREGDDEFTWDGYKFITDDMITAEITILNHRTIDPVTGEILIDYHMEIPQEIWMPSPTRTIGDSDILAYRLSHELENINISDLDKNYLYKNVTPTNQVKIEIKKPWYKRFLELFKPTEQVKIKNVKNSKININIK